MLNKIMSQKNIMMTSVSVIFIALFATFWSCNDNDVVEAEEKEWLLVWQDEFNYEGALDETKWAYDLGDWGWGNAELQNYTSEPENVKIEDGLLKITAQSGPYTSARVKTQGLFEQVYGRFEARIKMPYGQGIWPAFWLLGNNIEEVSWPQCGEIDIMEYRGQEPNIIHSTVHGPGYSGAGGVGRDLTFDNDRFDADFHVFAIEWDTDYIDFFVDDLHHLRITPQDVSGEWVYDHPFFIILNVAVGGNYVGSPNQNTTFPQTMEVDYVRVFKEM